MNLFSVHRQGISCIDKEFQFLLIFSSQSRMALIDFLALDAYYSFVPSLDGASFPESSSSSSFAPSAMLDLDEPSITAVFLSNREGLVAINGGGREE